MSWGDAAAKYVVALQAAGRAPTTIRLHRHYLNGLMEACPQGPRALTTEGLQAWLARPDWSPETRKSARSVARSFCRWAHGTGRIPDDPSARLAPVSVPAGRPRPTPEHLVRQLLRSPDERIARMVMLGAYAGLRAGEIARVHERDYTGDGVAGELIVHGKGGKVRAVPVVHGRLAVWLTTVEGWAFPNGLGSHLSPGHVTKLVSRALPEGWTAHTLRHRMGTQAYAGTRDLLAVQQILGHSRPETTQRYVLLPDDARRAAVAAACA